jgi:hypothetical protein
MTEEVDFLFDEQLVAAVIKLIRTSKHKLLLISPYIDLDARVMDALNEKLELHSFELKVLFGKNENNYLKSIKKDSLEYLRKFPNVEIRYNERLHAKFYMNDYEFIMTSLNLYDYSLANNIEVGIRCQHSTKGIMGKAIDITAGVIGQGVDKVKQDVMGFEKVVGPIEKFQVIFEASHLKYKTVPNVIEKGGIQGMMGGKKLDGFTVACDELRSTQSLTPIASSMPAVNYSMSSSGKSETLVTPPQLPVSKCVSASQLSKALGVSSKEINSLMQSKGFIYNDTITQLGLSKGLIMKNYMGADYIAYPENMEELNEFWR